MLTEIGISLLFAAAFVAAYLLSTKVGGPSVSGCFRMGGRKLACARRLSDVTAAKPFMMAGELSRHHLPSGEKGSTTGRRVDDAARL
jgi:hypothetical protein